MNFVSDLIAGASCEVRALALIFHLAPTFIFVLLLPPSFIAAPKQ